MAVTLAAKGRAVEVARRLRAAYPDAKCSLNFRTPLQLLVATILSAQCTDERVNIVTRELFKKYPTAADFARARLTELEKDIQSTGFYRNKAKNIQAACQEIVDRYGGQVPRTLEELVELPGVGRKTANVVLGHALGVPGLPVDRHVLRVSNRIGIAEGDDPVKVEAQICGALPKEMWTLASDVQILHGRRICRPKPMCQDCLVRDDCDYYEHVVTKEAERASKPKKTQAKVKRRDPHRIRTSAR
jgi:endonuclease-3